MKLDNLPKPGSTVVLKVVGGYSLATVSKNQWGHPLRTLTKHYRHFDDLHTPYCFSLGEWRQATEKDFDYFRICFNPSYLEIKNN
jgi:hypothetical protein